MSTDNIWDDDSWSDPVYFDNPGFDQDVSVRYPSERNKLRMETFSCSGMMMEKYIFQRQ